MTPHPTRLLLALITLSLLAGCSDETPAPREQAMTAEEALIEQGRRKARVCTGCHGPAGISRVPAYPSLAGRPADYLSVQLHAFRSGERDSPMMSSVAMNLSDEDIEALSHYFASLPAPEAQ